MDLFNNHNQPLNILPRDGVADYYGRLFIAARSDYYLELLKSTIDWKHDEIFIMGRLITTLREVAWYGDKGIEYTYSGTTKISLPWTKELLELKTTVEAKTGEQFNSCLLNYYHNGEEGMGWHTDAEKELKKNGAIASLSFGAERKFSFKHKITEEAVSIILENGSLLVMKGTVQTNWLHCLPKSKKVSLPRINLTFRTIENLRNQKSK
jgi:alkylated DNA repair dioxygenase AlkB